MHDCLIEDFIGISVDYATCYRISTISTKDFAFICCLIFKISSRIFLIRRRYLAYTLSFMNRSMSMRVYVGVCLFFNFVWMDLAVLKRLDFLQRFLCIECKNMGYFDKCRIPWREFFFCVDEANHKVEGRLRRGITITSTGLSLVLSRADIFVRLQNRLGSQIFLVICIRISSALDIGYFSKAGLPVRETTDAKKHLVTSTCATEKEVENQFSWFRKAVLIRPQWTKQLSAASIYFC